MPLKGYQNPFNSIYIDAGVLSSTQVRIARSSGGGKMGKGWLE